MKQILTKFRLYWPLTKSLQTGLLLSTGLAGYMTARCPIMRWYDFLGLVSAYSLPSLVLPSSTCGMTAISIPSCSAPTTARWLLVRYLPGKHCAWAWFCQSWAWDLAVFMSPLYGLIVFAGLFFDVVDLYLWLKRRTCWSIIWGGISGGMPILAGRTFGLGQIDAVGILLSLAILFWIPTHIMTFSMRYHADYQAAGVPTFPSILRLSCYTPCHCHLQHSGSHLDRRRWDT